MAQQPIVPLDNLIGGLATTNHPAKISSDQSPDVVNFQFDRGIPAKRRGFVRIPTEGPIFDTALDFSGEAASFVQIPECDDALDFTTTFTVECGFNLNSSRVFSAGAQTILDKSPDRASGWWLLFDNTGTLFFEFYTAGPSTKNTVEFDGPVDGWAHDTDYFVSITRNGTVAQAHWAVRDNNHVWQVTSEPAKTVQATASDNIRHSLLVGRRAHSTFDEHFFGKVAELRIWSVDRTASLGGTMGRALAPGDDTGLAGHWPFDFGEDCYQPNLVGGPVAHRSPSGPVWGPGLTPNNGGGIIGGPTPYAPCFDGWEDYIEIPVPAPPEDPSDPPTPWEPWLDTSGTGQEWTIECILKPECLDPDATYHVATLPGTPQPAVSVAVVNREIHVLIDGNFPLTYSPTNWASGNFDDPVHIAFTRNDGAIKLFVGGIERDSDTIPVASSFGDSGDLILGGWSASSPGSDLGGWVGYIDQWRMWRSVRTPIQIALYQDSYLPDDRDENLVHYLKFDEGRGTTVKDSSLSRANGTIKPDAAVPAWSQGIITPDDPPPIVAIYQFQRKDQLDA